MEKSEKYWFGVLIVIALLFNVLTLSNLVPWQKWLLWTHPTPDQSVAIQMGNYQITLPPEGIKVKSGQYVEFVATSTDVTYGLGVFKPEGRMVFQMQVLPGYDNRFVWMFDTPGVYDVRSTEYSGPRHPEMYISSAIQVIP